MSSGCSAFSASRTHREFATRGRPATESPTETSGRWDPAGSLKVELSPGGVRLRASKAKGYLRAFVWRRVVNWLRHKHRQRNWAWLRRASLADGRVTTCDRSRRWRGARDRQEVSACRGGTGRLRAPWKVSVDPGPARGSAFKGPGRRALAPVNVGAAQILLDLLHPHRRVVVGRYCGMRPARGRLAHLRDRTNVAQAAERGIGRHH